MSMWPPTALPLSADWAPAAVPQAAYPLLPQPAAPWPWPVLQAPVGAVATNAAPVSQAPAVPTAAGPQCIRCGQPTWNGQEHEYCTLACREAAGPLCIRPGCNYPTHNGQPNQCCTRKCRQALGEICGRPGCNLSTYDGNPGFCSRRCQAAANTLQPATPATVLPPAALHSTAAQAPADKFAKIQGMIDKKWPGHPPIKHIWKLFPKQSLVDAFERRQAQIGRMKAYGSGDPLGNVQLRFHGTKKACPGGSFQGKDCGIPGCSVCAIFRDGWQIKFLSTNSGDQGYYGRGHYSSSCPQTAIGYSRGSNCCFVVRVAVGRAEKATTLTLGAPIVASDSRFIGTPGQAGDELVVPNDDQMLAAYLVEF